VAAPAPLDVGGDHRATAEPRTPESPERRTPCEQGAHTGRVAEHLVERDRDEVRLPHRQVEPAGRHERGGVDDHVPASRLGQRDPVERVLDAGEVRLRWVREQVVAVGGDVVEIALEQPVRNPKIRRLERHIRRPGALRPRKLADPIDRVVVIERGQELVAAPKRTGLADQPQAAGRVGGEDARVLALGSVEVPEHGRARLLHEHRRRRRGRIDRVRVAVDDLTQLACSSSCEAAYRLAPV
jgi:hypothetical protein